VPHAAPLRRPLRRSCGRSRVSPALAVAAFAAAAALPPPPHSVFLAGMTSGSHATLKNALIAPFTPLSAFSALFPLKR
jgi:uncharacterized RDD family membrane protein YckC